MTPKSMAATRPGLAFTAMTDAGIGYGFNLKYSLADRSLDAYLCVGRENNLVKITGTPQILLQEPILAAIDAFGAWGANIKVWMIAKKNGTVVAQTPPIDFKTHVKPYWGRLRVAEIAAAQPRLTFPGIGVGRLLSRQINSRYYFIYNGYLETDNAYRGFDCTSFPMALLSIRSLAAPGRGRQVCEAAGATKCDLEQLDADAIAQRFRDDTIPGGLYVVFSASHVMLYNSDINMLYEFNVPDGFRATPAGKRTMLPAPQRLWWLRKLSESYRPAFT